MFSFHKYTNHVYDVKWYFDDDQKEVLEDKLQCLFRKINDYYCISYIPYTFLDVFEGLGDVDFIMKKYNNECRIQIEKIN